LATALRAVRCRHTREDALSTYKRMTLLVDQAVRGEPARGRGADRGMLAHRFRG
jgi:hypothetical protein